ncbi:MAG: DUF2442 domain-containing protein [Phycisphaerae bacterium]
MLPRVKSVKPMPDYQLEIVFTNGDVGLYDCRPLLDFGVFRELRDETYFRQVRVVLGAVAWPHEQDICPDTLYLDSRRVQPAAR